MELIAFEQLGIALGLGLLVGLQREWDAPHVAGIRTFAMIPVLGALCAQLSLPLGPWIVAAGMLALAAVLILGRVMKVRAGKAGAGLTTEVAALVMYAVGAVLVLGQMTVALAVGGAVVVLLQYKKPLHAFVDRIGQEDIRAIIQLALIALVILPILPNQAYGPYHVLNPFRIWLLVVLIVGLSVAGYILYRFLGPRVGTLVAGVLGGVISSTATTVSYARQARRAPTTAALSAVVVVIASVIVFGRVIFEVAVVAPDVLAGVIGPLLAVTAWMAVVAAGLYFLTPRHGQDVPTRDSPAQLRAAIVFGLLYAAVLFAVAVAKEHFGDRGLYVVSALSGLTDMDAITLSTAQMIDTGKVASATGWRMILLGAMSNLVFKVVMVAALGGRAMLKRVAVAFGLSIAGATAVVAFWP